jgi:hypothetical protein
MGIDINPTCRETTKIGVGTAKARPVSTSNSTTQVVEISNESGGIGIPDLRKTGEQENHDGQGEQI